MTYRRADMPLWTMLAVALVATAWSAVGTRDYGTWFFELSIGGVGIGVLAAVAPRFRFTPMVYLTAAAHFVILAIGAKYSYAEAPPGNWLRDALGLDRNPFDRVGHFAQGFTPALIAREVLVRVGEVRRAWLVLLLSAAVPLAFSALYEIVEWGWVLAFYPDQGPEWLGMQGDPWDAQWDMFMALVGAAAALVCLGRLQARWLTAGVITAMLPFASSVLPFVNTTPRMARKSAVCDRCDTRVASMPLVAENACRAELAVSVVFGGAGGFPLNK